MVCEERFLFTYLRNCNFILVPDVSLLISLTCPTALTPDTTHRQIYAKLYITIPNLLEETEIQKLKEDHQSVLQAALERRLEHQTYQRMVDFWINMATSYNEERWKRHPVQQYWNSEHRSIGAPCVRSLGSVLETYGLYIGTHV